MTESKPHIFNFITIVSGMLFMLAQSSCGNGDSGTIDLLPAQIEDSDKWSFVAADGTVAADNLFDECPTMSINGYFSVSEADGISVYNSDAPSMPVDSLTGLRAAGVMSDGVIPIVRRNSRIALVDGNGAVIKESLGPIDDNEIDAVAPYFSCGRMIFRITSETGHLFGAIDHSGEIAIAPIFARLCPFRNNIALAAIASDDSADRLTYMLVDRSGEPIFTFPAHMTPLSDGPYQEIMPVRRGDKIGFINTRGDFRAAPDDVVDIPDFTDHIFAYKTSDGLLGLMTMEFESLLEPEFKSIEIIDNDHILARKSKADYQLLNARGEEICSFEDAKKVVSLRNVFPFRSDFRLIVRNADNTYNIYSIDGEPLNTERFDAISDKMVVSSISTTCGDMIQSDYFNAELAVSELLKPLTANSYDGKYIGSQLITHGDPEEYLNTYSTKLLAKKGYRYSIEAKAYSAVAAAQKEAVYDTTTFLFFQLPEFKGYDYSFNPDAHVNRITATLTTDVETFTATRRMIETRLTAEGMQTAERQEAYSTYRSPANQTTLMLIAAPKQHGTIIYLLSEESAIENRKKIIREAEINYNLPK